MADPVKTPDDHTRIIVSKAIGDAAQRLTRTEPGWRVSPRELAMEAGLIAIREAVRECAKAIYEAKHPKPEMGLHPINADYEDAIRARFAWCFNEKEPPA